VSSSGTPKGDLDIYVPRETPELDHLNSLNLLNSIPHLLTPQPLVQIIVLSFSHGFYFRPCFVSISTQVKGAMENNPMKLGSKGVLLFLGIIPNPVEAYVDLGSYQAGFREVKCDDIGIVVVLQELSVDFQQPLVCAEYIVDRFNSLSFLFKKGMNE
jgi:hypothetical protein